MNIEVADLSPVDKKITISANRTDLEPTFNKALRKLSLQVNLPGFRPGKAPLNLLKKRFSKDVEMEEVYKFVEDTFHNTIVPEHNPVGQPRFGEISWENDELNAVVEIALKPDFELIDLKTITIDKLVHDVNDEDVEKEVEFALKKWADWSEVDGAVEADDRITVDSVEIDAAGTPLEDTKEEDVQVTLSEDGTEPIRKDLVGKKVGDAVEVNYGSDNEPSMFQLTIKKIERSSIPELSDALVAEKTNGQLTTIDDYKARIKSEVQNYFDRTSDNLGKDMAFDKLINTYDFEVPNLIVEEIVKETIERIKKSEESKDINTEDEEFLANSRERAKKEARWMFIAEELRAKNDKVEITKEDVEAYYERKAAEFNLPADILKQYYSSNEQMMQQAFHEMRDEKLFSYILDEVSVNELSKEDFEKKHSKK